MGRACVDHTLVLPANLQKNRKFPILKQWVSGGGQAATAAVVMALLGGRSQYVGVLGQDEDGDFLLQEFANFGVDTTHIRRFSNYKTPKAYIIVEEISGERTVLYEPTPKREYVPLPLADISHARTLILDPEISSADLQRVLQAKRKDGYIIYDAERRRGSLTDMMKYADFFIASETILDMEVTKPRVEMWHYLAENIQGHWLLTFGALGSLYIDKNRLGWHVGSLPDMAVVDTTGAGDVYHAAFAWHYPRHTDIVQAMKFASVCAGLSITQPGTRHKDLFDHQQIEQKMLALPVRQLSEAGILQLLQSKAKPVNMPY